MQYFYLVPAKNNLVSEPNSFNILLSNQISAPLTWKVNKVIYIESK